MVADFLSEKGWTLRRVSWRAGLFLVGSIIAGVGIDALAYDYLSPDEWAQIPYELDPTLKFLGMGMATALGTVVAGVVVGQISRTTGMNMP